MEISVTKHLGLPDDAIVSVRSGLTRRQAPLDTVLKQPLKFPAPLESVSEPLKIDVLQKVASARLVLRHEDESYDIGFDEPGMCLGLNVQNASAGGGEKQAGKPDERPPSAKYQDAATSARDYLEMHGLLCYVQSLLHAVIQVRPKDPYSFMVMQLCAASRTTTPAPSRPTSAHPGRAGPLPRSPIRPEDATDVNNVLKEMGLQAEPPAPAPGPSAPVPPEQPPPALPLFQPTAEASVVATQAVVSPAACAAPQEPGPAPAAAEASGVETPAVVSVVAGVAPPEPGPAPVAAEASVVSTPAVASPAACVAPRELGSAPAAAEASVVEAPAVVSVAAGVAPPQPGPAPEAAEDAAEGCSEDMQGLASRLRDALSEAEGNGLLTAAIQEALPVENPPRPHGMSGAQAAEESVDMELIRQRMQGLIEEAAQTGELTSALEMALRPEDAEGCRVEAVAATPLAENARSAEASQTEAVPNEAHANEAAAATASAAVAEAPVETPGARARPERLPPSDEPPALPTEPVGRGATPAGVSQPRPGGQSTQPPEPRTPELRVPRELRALPPTGPAAALPSPVAEPQPSVPPPRALPAEQPRQETGPSAVAEDAPRLPRTPPAVTAAQAPALHAEPPRQTAGPDGAPPPAESPAEVPREEDAPGWYVIQHHHTFVATAYSKLEAQDIAGVLDAGQEVYVLEVRRDASQVRGRIESPAGWISLLNLDDGYRFATRQEEDGEGEGDATSVPVELSDLQADYARTVQDNSELHMEVARLASQMEALRQCNEQLIARASTRLGDPAP